MIHLFYQKVNPLFGSQPFQLKGDNNMNKYVCTVCGYVYDEAEGDPDNGIAPGTKWDALPEDFVCPLCGVGKDLFEVE